MTCWLIKLKFKVTKYVMQNIRYLIPRKTELRYAVLKGDKLSKEKQWMQIEGVPCKVVVVENNLSSFILNSFASSDQNANFRVSFQDANDNFTSVEPNEQGYLCLLYTSPSPRDS